MKIKSDFITNSSSTSYVVCIPDELKVENISDKFLRYCIEEEYEGGPIDDEEAKERMQELREKLIELLQSLKTESSNIDSDGEAYIVIDRLCDELGFVIKNMDNHPNDSAMSSVDLNKLKEKIKEIESGEWKNKLKEL